MEPAAGHEGAWPVVPPGAVSIGAGRRFQREGPTGQLSDRPKEPMVATDSQAGVDAAAVLCWTLAIDLEIDWAAIERPDSDEPPL
jgi:hypothetical protein